MRNFLPVNRDSPLAAGDRMRRSQRHALSTLVFTLFLVWCAELLLLQRKFDIFTGGFLQPYGLLVWGKRLEFVVFSLILDSAFFVNLWVVWYVAAARMTRARSEMTAYHFIWVAGGISSGVVGAKWELLSYFSDAVTFRVIKNLAGGSLTDALKFALDEVAVAIYVIVTAFAVYFAGFLILRRRLSSPAAGVSSGETNRPLSSGQAVLVLVLAWVLGASVLTVSANDEAVHYNLSKKISYIAFNTALTMFTDFDGDGYGAIGLPRDPAPFDAAVFPGALDVPNNGLDEDGLYGDFTWDGSMNPPLPFAASTGLAPKKHLVFIVIESCRADVLGKVVNGREVAPNLNRLTREGTSLPFAYSHVAYTVHSLKAIFSGQMVQTHTATTMFSYLKALGVDIGVFSGQDESFGGMARFTRSKEFATRFFDSTVAPNDRVFFSNAPGSAKLDEKRVLREVKAYINEADWSRKQFLYINLQSAHFPYRHIGMPNTLGIDWLDRSQIAAERRDRVADTYWNAIAYADQSLGEVVAALHDKGVSKDTIVVVIGDHGESLFDDGLLGHGTLLNEVQTHIPLVINVPGVIAPQPIGQADLARLLLGLMNGERAVDWPKAGTGPRTVFQFIGSIDRPSQIALVGANKERTVLDFRKQAAFFHDELRWMPVSKASEDKRLDSRLRTLVFEWERMRWEAARMERESYIP